MGGLSGRVDQTVHTMSLLHKLRKTRPHSYVLSEESLAWVLDKVGDLVEPGMR
jgi:thiamine pyrophosphokinase